MTTEMMPVVPSEERTSWTAWRMPTLALVPVAGLVWWLAGYLPWLIDGLGHEFFGGMDGITWKPLAVPLISGYLAALVLGAGVGGVAAGAVTVLARGSRPRRAIAATAGVLLAVLVTLVESRQVLGSTGLVSLDDDSRITNGLTAIVLVTTFVGLALGLLSLTGTLGAGFALAAAAGAAPIWLMDVFYAVHRGDVATMHHLQDVTRWTGAAVLAVALVIVGLRPLWRIAAWVGVVLLAWVVGPTMTSTGYFEVFLRPGTGLPDLMREQLSATADVWRMAASPGARPLTPWIAAIIVGAAAALWRASRTPTPDA